MALKIKAICSECLTMHKATIDFGQENIQCPACGHALKNLPEPELVEIESTIKGQRTNNIIAIIAFVIAVTFFFLYVFNQIPEMYRFLQEETRPEADSSAKAYPILAGIGILVTLVFAILGARKRHVIEF